MTIIISAAIQNAFIFGSESRQVLSDENWFRSVQKKDYTNRNFEIHPGVFPKTFLIGEQYALNYSGPGFIKNWLFEAELFGLQQMAGSGHYTIYDLAHYFNDKLMRVLAGQPFEFHLAGFPGGRPVWAESNDGKLVFYRVQKDATMNRIAVVGMTDIIDKVLDGEMLDFEHMTLKDVVEFVWLTIIAGSKYLEYFTKYPAVSGGPVTILILTPNGHEILKLPAFGLQPHKGGVLA